MAHNYYAAPKISRPVDYAIVIAFGPGTHYEIELSDNDVAWVLHSEPELPAGTTAARFYAARLRPHIEALAAELPAGATAVLRALANGLSRREIRKQGIGRHE